MLTAYQIIQRVNTEYPNNGFVYDPETTYETKVEQGFIDYINSALNRMDKSVLLDDIYEFPLIAGQSIYELPINCELGNIEEVTRNYGLTSMRLIWARDSEHMFGNCYFNGYGNTIGIYPEPTHDGDKITLYFKRTPRPVKTVDDPIEIDDKWADLLVYSIISDMASGGSNPDIEIANNYIARYNNLLQDARLGKCRSQPYCPKIKDNKKPPLSVLRRGFRR